MRKHPLSNGYIYHIFTKSIAGYKVFRTAKDYKRMVELFKYYRLKKPPTKFSLFIEIKEKGGFIEKFINKEEHIVEIYAYCLMPTHIHLVVKQIEDNGILEFMKKVLDSYTRYFNLKNKRKGPLWQSRFKSVIVGSDEQLLHLTRYLHLNPTSDGLVERPEEWKYSSYVEYIGLSKEKICRADALKDISTEKYREFVEERKDYQKTLSMIKEVLFY